MKWFPLTICTVTCALGGWLLGRSLEPEAPAPGPAPAVSAAALPATTPPPAAPLVGEALDRIAALVKEKKSTTEITVRVYEEMKDLRLEDFPTAIAMAHDAPGVGSLGGFLLAGYWAERDLESAKKWLFSLPAAQREIFAPSIGATWGRLQPGGLFDWLESLPDEELHKVGASLTTVLAHGAPGIDPARVADLFLALPSNGGAWEFRSLFAGWARTAPAVAADKALTLPVGAARTAAVEGVVSAWARLDPQAAGAWAQNLPDAALAARALPAYAEGLAQKDPAGAVAFVAELPATQANREALQSVVKVWTANNSAAALAWAEKLDDESLRGQILSSMMDTLASTDVDAAARIYTQHSGEVSVMASFAGIHFVESYFNRHGMDAILQLAANVPDSEREALVAYAAETWSGRNNDELAAWALQRPEGPERSEGLHAAVSRKLGAGKQIGIDWLHSLPSTPSSDLALNYGGRMLFSTDPDVAAEILGRVLDPRMGHGKLLDLTQMWLRRDASAARLWIEKTPTLTAPEKAAFLRTP